MCSQLKRSLLYVLLLLLCTGGTLARAQDELITMNMRNADIGAVIQWMAEQTNKKIVIDPRVKGKVTVLANAPMSVDQAFDVFLTMLDVYGFAATESSGILRIAPAAMANSAPTAVVDNFNNIGSATRVVHIMKVNNVSATELSKTLKPMVMGGLIEAYTSTNSLIIADQADNVRRLVALIDRIDSSGDLNNLEVIPLEHADAEKVAGLVESLIAKDASRPFSVASDQRANALVMSGDETVRNQVKRLLKQLDRPIDRAGNTRVVYLHYLDADEVVPILKGMTDAIKEDNKNASTNSATVSIEASASSNALVMTGPPDVLSSMEEVIKKVDIRRAQVLVEAIIVEVSHEGAKNIGVEWNTALNGDGAEAITSFGGRTFDQDGNISLLGAGLTLGFYNGGSLRVLIRALAANTDANILSTPSLLTLDNQEAEILVGSNVPLVTGQVTSDSSSTMNPFTTIERHDIGLTLKITPQINRGDAITLDVLQEMESIADTVLVADQVNDIVTNKRSIRTKVLVDDQRILVLGGLISDEETETVNKVPFFGDVPLIGGLFRSTSTQTVKRNLMVFIHPVIVTSPEVGDEVTSDRYHLMQKLQQQFEQREPLQSNKPLKDFEEYRPAVSAPAETELK